MFTLGDILVIGLNSDNSVSKIKPGRPLIPERQRAEVLSALHMIDYITLFDEDTPYELIWEKKDIVGSDIVRDVRTIPFVEGVSTSEIIKKIQTIK
jgi:D-beta-D-heptose 7-phosphate kinase/D-beta-D-heptose 1-phosphate adenosyltransferase